MIMTCISHVRDFDAQANLIIIIIDFLQVIYYRTIPGSVCRNNEYMFLLISKDKTIQEIQQPFSSKYPFLKLEFYKMKNANPVLAVKKHLSHSITLKAAGLKDNGLIDIQNDLTVADFEKIFLTKFGLNVQVSRRSGTLWLETTMTDKRSLQKQNEHGREITLSAIKTIL